MNIDRHTGRPEFLVDPTLVLCSVPPHLLAFTCRFSETVSGRANPFPRCDRKPLRRQKARERERERERCLPMSLDL